MVAVCSFDKVASHETLFPFVSCGNHDKMAMTKRFILKSKFVRTTLCRLLLVVMKFKSSDGGSSIFRGRSVKRVKPWEPTLSFKRTTFEQPTSRQLKLFEYSLSLNEEKRRGDSRAPLQLAVLLEKPR